MEVRSPHAVQLQFEIIRRIKTVPIFYQALEMSTDNLAFDEMMKGDFESFPVSGATFAGEEDPGFFPKVVTQSLHSLIL